MSPRTVVFKLPFFNALHIVLPRFNAPIHVTAHCVQTTLLHIVLPVSTHYSVSMHHCTVWKLPYFNAMHNVLLRFSAFRTTPSPAVLPCLQRSIAPCSLHDTAAIYNVAGLFFSVLYNISCQHSFIECKQFSRHRIFWCILKYSALKWTVCTAHTTHIQYSASKIHMKYTHCTKVHTYAVSWQGVHLAPWNSAE